MLSKYFLLVLFGAFVYKSSAGDCPTTLRNLVVRQGQPFTLPHAKGSNVQYDAAPSSLTFNIRRTLSTNNMEMHSEYADLFTLTDEGLTCHNATTSTDENSTIATAGLYMLKYLDENCTTSAKVLVLRSGPTCACGPTVSNQELVTKFICSVIYADTAKNEVYPKFRFYMKIRGKTQLMQEKMPLPERINKYEFESSSEYIWEKESLGLTALFWWELTFSAPPKYPVQSVDQQEPDFIDRCDYSKLKCSND